MCSQKQKFELNAARLFQLAGGIPADFTLRPGGDPPDVLASSGETCVGIEIRRIFADESRDGSAQRRHYQLSGQIVSLAQELHRESTNRFFYVHVRVNRTVALHDRRIPEIARRLVDIVSRSAIAVGEDVTIQATSPGISDWPEEIEHIEVAILDLEGQPFWGLTDSAWAGRTSQSLIQQMLDSKEQSCSSFRDEVDEKWLLLVCDGSVGSSFLEVHRTMPEESYSSSFDRAFVMDYSGESIAEIPLRQGN